MPLDFVGRRHGCRAGWATQIRRQRSTPCICPFGNGAIIIVGSGRPTRLRPCTRVDKHFATATCYHCDPRAALCGSFRWCCNVRQHERPIALINQVGRVFGGSLQTSSRRHAAVRDVARSGLCLHQPPAC